MRYIWDASPAALTPSFFFSSMKVAEYLPLGWFQDLVKSREVLREQTIACVARKHPRPCEGLQFHCSSHDHCRRTRSRRERTYPFQASICFQCLAQTAYDMNVVDLKQNYETNVVDLGSNYLLSPSLHRDIVS